MNLTTSSKERKEQPMARGCIDYFPNALAEVSHVSLIGNRKHNPGEEMHWAKEKSTDHADCIARHLADRGTRDPEDGLRHSAKIAWRALALLQIEIEKDAAKPGTAMQPTGDGSCQGSMPKPASPKDDRPRNYNVYISGPMRGIPDYNFPAFDAARDKLTAAGYTVTSPADMDRKDAWPQNQITYAMRDTKILIDLAHTGRGAIYMLPGWKNSVGAKAEHYLAVWLGLEIIYADVYAILNKV